MTRTLEINPLKGSNINNTIEVGDRLCLIENPKENPPPGYGCFRFISEKDGDKRYTWDSRDFLAIQQAKELFDKAVVEGLVPYRVGIDGKATAEVMTEFDAWAEEVLFLPADRIAGG